MKASRLINVFIFVKRPIILIIKFLKSIGGPEALVSLVGYPGNIPHPLIRNISQILRDFVY